MTAAGREPHHRAFLPRVVPPGAESGPPAAG